MLALLRNIRPFTSPTVTKRVSPLETRSESRLQVSGHSHFSSEIVEGSQRQHAQTLSGSDELTRNSVDGPISAARDHDVIAGLGSLPGSLA